VGEGVAAAADHRKMTAIGHFSDFTNWHKCAGAHHSKNAS
jgi:hypothetical protein